MDLAKPGLIHKFCRTNAMLTFKEYLMDYASPETLAAGNRLVEELVERTQPAGTKRSLLSRLKKD